MSEYDHWNDPSVLPPVGCPLVIKAPCYPLGLCLIFAGQTHAVRCERTVHVEEKSRLMTYQFTNGLTLRGRYPWTYP